MRAALSPQQTTKTLIEAEYRELDRRIERVHPSGVAFELTAYDPAAVARARRLWIERMVNEYTSTTVFSQLAAQMIEANAPLDATAVTLRMAQDELRHAEICGEVVRQMGGSSTRMRDTSVVPIARHAGSSDEERAIRNVIFTTCLSEMNSVSYFVAVLERLEDPYLRETTRRLLADEVLHGRFGFTYLEAWSEWLRKHPDTRASIGRYLRYAFAVVELEYARDEQREVMTLSRDDVALGVVPPGFAAEIFRTTMTEAVIPGLERFDIPAESAWLRRALS